MIISKRFKELSFFRLCSYHISAGNMLEVRNFWYASFEIWLELYMSLYVTCLILCIDISHISPLRLEIYMRDFRWGLRLYLDCCIQSFNMSNTFQNTCSDPWTVKEIEKLKHMRHFYMFMCVSVWECYLNSFSKIKTINFHFSSVLY